LRDFVSSSAGSGSVVILDLDGVLVDLGLDTERVRRDVGALFAGEGVAAQLTPLEAGIEAASARVEDPAQAERLRARAWRLIDEEESRCIAACRPRPGGRELLERLAALPVALYTDHHREAALAALRRVGIDPQRFIAIRAREGPRSIKPAAAPLTEILAAHGGADRLWLVGGQVADMRSAALAREALAATGSSTDVLAIGAVRDLAQGPHMEEAGASFVVSDLEDAGDLILAPRSPCSLSIVLLAWNEQASIEAAIRDARRFGRLYLSGCEVVVVDDGSNDDTSRLAAACAEGGEGRGDVRIVRHATNLGMGAAMRDGYAAATKDYIAPLPADRQVRAQSLVRLLPHLAPERIAVSSYIVPPSGELRRRLSQVFRFLVEGVGRMRVDFAGTYAFHRRWLERVDLARVRSETFVFSFELLERLREAGASFERVWIRPFPREVGVSRELALGRIARVAGEILRYRWRRLREART
jgi:phosphoglycolate phosphatase-like HAD superfamily hydrolase